MSLFSWFQRKSAPAKPRSKAVQGGAAHPGAGAQSGPGQANAADPRKNERIERRELLYTVVRDAMVRAGVLSASYKFKVLSLDARGRQFLVMMDLAREYGGETVRLSEIEDLITQTARTRYEISVIAVYWRINDSVALGIAQKGVAPLGAGLPAAPAAAAAPLAVAAASAVRRPPLAAAVPAAAATARAALAASEAPWARPSANAPLLPVNGPRHAQRYEPIEADEVAAFKRALASAAAGTAAAPLSAKPGVAVRSGPLLPPSPVATGFEDTEMPGSDQPGTDLSTTQYGDLH
jgi:hypothetical protein